MDEAVGRMGMRSRDSSTRRRLVRWAWLVLALAPWVGGIASVGAINLPTGFVDEVVLSGIDSSAGFDFAPDGRIFFSERITGRLRTATYDAGSGTWTVEPLPYATFDIPVDGGGTPTAHRSSGLRDFAFDPDFATNGRLYVFYMRHNPRHNRVVRIEQDPADARVALPGETLLLDMPFNSSSSSGSHNGGAIEFGADGNLYVTTGDGWNGGDPVQSLSTYTGKVFRIAPDGTIPTDNPFHATASGPLRAIYALGLRNPYSMTRHPTSGVLYVNEAAGSDKTRILQVTAAANHGHQGFGGIGVNTGPWHDSSITGGADDKLVTGGAWYTGAQGTLPAEYSGRLFVCHWGTNGSGVGVINTVASETDLTTERFADNVDKPVNLRIGPDGHIYYMDTTYETASAAIHRIRYTGQAAVATPEVLPPAGIYFPSVDVTLSTATAGATIYYTVDGADPTTGSAVYTGTFTLNASATVKARAFASGLDPSGVASADFVICADASCNLPPVANAGADREVEVGVQAFLSGSASFDPDTSELLLSDSWQQTGGAGVTLLNDDETVAYFTPPQTGCYRFEYEIADPLSVDVDDVELRAYPCLDGPPAGLVGEWRFDEGQGGIALETAAGANHGQIVGAGWGSGRTADAAGALDFDGVDDLVSLGALDLDSPELTLSAWIRIDDFDQMDGRIISKANGVQDVDHIWMLSTIASGPDHVLRFRLRTGGATTTLIAAGTPLQTGIWVHVAATYDGAEMRIWQDGVAVAQAAKSGMVDTDPTMGAAIGNQPAGDRPFDGVIDDVRIFDRGLGATEVARIAAFHRPFDVDESGAVDGADLIPFIAAPFDLDGSGEVDAADEACLQAYVDLDCSAPPQVGGCPDTPAMGCVDGFARGLLVVKETVPGRERLTAKLTQGPALLASDFGDPLSPGGTGYSLCVYDDVGTLVGEATVDRAGEDTCGGDDCWRGVGPLGYLFRDKGLSSDGIRVMRLRGGPDGRSQIVIRGKNDAPKGHFALPVPIAPALVGASSASLQLHTSDGSGCFSKDLAAVVRADPDFFKAKQ